MIVYILMIIISVLLHEFGHLLTALYFKLNVKAFSIGFGKILLHKKWKKIDWRISLIPLGGYCDIEERIGYSNSLAEIPYWKQMIVILAGVGMNCLIAFCCYLVHFQSIKLGLYIDWTVFKMIILKNYSILANLIVIYNLNLILLQISLLNISLAITNLLPIPALDGGYIWLLLLQRKISEKIYKIIIYSGFLILIFLQIFLIYYWWLT